MPWNPSSIPPPLLQLPPDCVLLPPADNQAARRAQASLVQLARVSAAGSCQGDLLKELARRQLGRGRIKTASLISRLSLDCKLGGHSKGLNSVQLARLGGREVAVTCSDDLRVILWDVGSRRKLQEVRTQHEIVLTQARMVGEEQLVTSCMDGQVRLCNLASSSNSRLLVQHRGSVYRLAAPPHSPQLLLSGGEDGQVFLLDLRAPSPTKLLALRDRRDRKVQVYSIAANPVDPLQFCLTGRDSKLRLLDVRHLSAAVALLTPPLLPRDAETDPNEAVYNPSGTEVIVSFDLLRHTDKSIYLFSTTSPTGSQPLQVFNSYRDSPALGWMGDEVVVSGSNTAYAGLTSGDIFFWERNSGGVLHCVQGDNHGIVRGLASLPSLPLLASCGVDSQLKIWRPGPLAPVLLAPCS